MGFKAIYAFQINKYQIIYIIHYIRKLFFLQQKFNGDIDCLGYIYFPLISLSEKHLINKFVSFIFMTVI